MNEEKWVLVCWWRHSWQLDAHSDRAVMDDSCMSPSHPSAFTLGCNTRPSLVLTLSKQKRWHSHLTRGAIWSWCQFETQVISTQRCCFWDTQVPSWRGALRSHQWGSRRSIPDCLSPFLKPFDSSSSTTFGWIKTQVFTLQFSWLSSRSGALRHNVITVGLPVPQQWFSTGGTGSKSGSVFKGCVCVPGNMICV